MLQLRKPMKKNKRAFILTEMVIALSLISIVFSFLFRSYFDFIKSNNLLKTIEEKWHCEHKMYLRLNQIFDNLEKPGLFPHFSAKNPIYSQIDQSDEKLCFVFNNDIDPDPEFSGVVLGELYFKKEGLFLNVTSKKGHKRIEIDYPGISRLKWEFFDPQAKTWTSEWSIEKSFPPLILKLTIKENRAENERAFCFFLDDPKVIYPQGEIQP